MTKAKSLPWWQLPAILTGSVALLGTLGTVAVRYATFASIPQRVEAAEQKNIQQDRAIDRLTTVEETWQKIYQQQQQVTNIQTPPVPQTQYWRDPKTHIFWCCEADCDRDESWTRCEQEP